jgi:glycosyltransferase involved in cell wall biosynthesis
VGAEHEVPPPAGIGEIDRRGCRHVFEQRFSAERMAGRYLEVYRRLQPGPRA